MFELRLFGAPEITGPDGRLTGRPAQRRRIALLAVLALSRHRTVSRDTLVAMFWPRSEAERARHNLADTIYVLRKALGEDSLVSIGDDLTLSADAVASDVDDFSEALEQGDLEVAAALYGSPFLDGVHVSGAPGFERWLDEQRSRLAAEYAGALEARVEETRLAGAVARAAAWSRRLTALEPLNSRFALLHMRALADGGDPAGAIRHGERHAELLEAELELPADPAVLALVHDLRNGQQGFEAAPPTAETPGASRRASATMPW